MSTKQRQKHNLDLPRIAKAIQEYKTTNKTQKQCADDAGITVKLFSYYYLNGFKKSQKLAGGNFHSNDANTNSVIKEDAPQPNIKYERKAKLRDNNYEIVLVGEQTETNKPSGGSRQIAQQKIMQNNTTNTTNFANPTNATGVIGNQSIRNKLAAATTVSSTGVKKVNLSAFMNM